MIQETKYRELRDDEMIKKGDRYFCESCKNWHIISDNYEGMLIKDYIFRYKYIRFIREIVRKRMG